MPTSYAFSLKRRLKCLFFNATTALFYERKLFTGLSLIATAPIENLRDAEKLTQILRGIGLSHDHRGLYGADIAYMNRFGEGLLQIPKQLAEALILLSHQNIRNAVEVGTYQGWTGSVIAAYLQRFVPEFQMTTIDPVALFHLYPRIRKNVPITFRQGVAADLKDLSPDLSFIDGDHAYASVKDDYQNLGRRSRVCMFHDINDKFVGVDHVPKFWAELKSAEKTSADFYEFTYQSEGDQVMGIGIRVRRASA